MFVLLIQKHLEEGGSVQKGFGVIQHNNLAPVVQLRINTRMQIDLELPSVRVRYFRRLNWAGRAYQGLLSSSRCCIPSRVTRRFEGLTICPAPW